MDRQSNGVFTVPLHSVRYRFHMPKMLRVVFLLLTMSCGAVPGVLTESEFANKYATQLCDRTFDCDGATAEAFWGTEDDCQSETRTDLKESYGKDCDYDAKTARSCLKSFKELSCNPHYEVIQDHLDLCEAIWVCDDA